MQEYYDLVQKGFRILLPQLAGYIGREMHSVYHDGWWQEVLEALSDQRDLPESGDYATLMDSLDVANCLRLIDRRWRDVFSRKMSKSYRNWASELMGVRNAVAHVGSEDLQQPYAERALDTMALLCEAIDPETTEEIRALYRKVRYGNEQGTQAVTEIQMPAQEGKQTKSAPAAGVLKKNVGENLPSWRDVMQPQPDVAEGRYKAAEFAADLAQVSRGEGAYEYRDPVEFFARTYITEGMEGLLVESLRRVSSQGGEPVIQLKTAFGGGKTHSMLALYHMLRGKTSIEYIPSLKPVLEKAGLDQLPKANVAVLVGTAMDPTKRRNPADLPGYTVSTIWGEMAHQLVVSAGKPELYAKYIRESDRKGVSPGSENLKNLFNECGPCLVLMDELVAYGKKLYGVEGLAAGSYDNFVTFIQEITEAARASENSLVVASIPESDIEIGGEAGKTVLETIEHTFGRMETVWKPVAANEGFEIVRRRLFLDCKDPEARDRVCEAFSQMYQNDPTAFPIDAKEVEYKKRLQSCYPIHPEIFDRLYGDWATLEHFQRTRGVLRLMAAVIHELWMANDESAMIMPGSLPLDMPLVRDELVRYLPETWNSIIDREVDGKASIPYQKDKENPRYGQSLACRRIARTIMLGSAPGTSALRSQGIRGLEVTRIMLGTVQPGESIANFRDALYTLHGSLTYLYNNSNMDRFWYDTKPTLRKTMEDRATQVSPEDVAMELESRLKKTRKTAPFAGIHVCPASSNDVPDEQAARLVILRPHDTYKRGSTDCFAMKCVEDILNNRGNSPRIYRNMLAFLAPDMDKIGSVEQETRRFMAWTSIQSDKDDLNLDQGQLNETKNNLNRSNKTVDMRLKEAYCWLLVPYIDQDGDMKTIQWEISDVGGGDDELPVKAARKMEQMEQIITKWAPALLQMCLDDVLWKDSDDISVKKLWEYLSTYCYLPRLSGYFVLEQAIREGVASDEYFALAAAYNGERYVDLRLKQAVSSINPSDLLVKVDVAKKQFEEERKAKEEEMSRHSSGTAGSGDGASGESSSGNGFSEIPAGGGSSAWTESAGGTGDVIDRPAEPINRHFHMSVKLDNIRANRDLETYLQEIIRHLTEVDGADVEMNLDVEVSAPKGVTADVVRTVSENCRTLNITDFGFED